MMIPFIQLLVFSKLDILAAIYKADGGIFHILFNMFLVTNMNTVLGKMI